MRNAECGMRSENETGKGKIKIRKLWFVIVLLALLAPLGVIVPALFGAGGAWGEWGVEEIKKLVGYVPEGMDRLAHLWKSPLRDYTVPGQKPGLLHKSLGYIATAIIGVAVAGGAAYALAKLLGRKDS